MQNSLGILLNDYVVMEISNCWFFRDSLLMRERFYLMAVCRDENMTSAYHDINHCYAIIFSNLPITRIKASLHHS